MEKILLLSLFLVPPFIQSIMIQLKRKSKQDSMILKKNGTLIISGKTETTLFN